MSSLARLGLLFLEVRQLAMLLTHEREPRLRDVCIPWANTLVAQRVRQ
jgi:hypothetical protein